MRTISVSEIGALMDCERRHAFAYTGHVTGGQTLKKRNPAITLRRGRGWGRAVAAWHETGDDAAAYLALAVALDEDAQEQRDAGIYTEDDHRNLLAHLTALLVDYIATAERLPLTDAELELAVPLPSRTGKRNSNRYSFQGFVDGLTREYRLPGLWVVEYKLRDRLQSFEQVVASRQIRWYAWAAERQFGERVEGVIVDERLNEVPRPPRTLKNGKPSHDKSQLTTPALYLAACEAAGEEVNQETLVAFGQRAWQRRHPVTLRRSEIEEAGRELVSAGAAIAEMDSGHRYPIANRSQFTCPRCPFKDICNDPTGDLTDFEFDLTQPKRLRAQEEKVVSAQTTLAEAVPA